jgi:GNAT superfamily N-acetyltransferase
MAVPVKELSAFDRPTLMRHFLALAGEDRRLRFGGGLRDEAVERYVEGIDFVRDAVLGVVDDELRVVGAAHLARGASFAELGVSVLPEHRGRGLGAALLRRAHTHARNWGVRELFMHCLAENGAMMHIARAQGMDIAQAGGEADAWLKLPPADATSHLGEMFDQRTAMFDYALKGHFASARRALEIFQLRLAASASSPGARPAKP